MCAVETVFKTGNLTALHNMWLVLIFLESSPAAVLNGTDFIGPSKRLKYGAHHL